MTLQEIVMHKIRYWQITLNLTDWTINFQLVPLKVICNTLKAEAYAYITYRALTKTATVYLPNDLTFDTIANLPAYDFLIVHEFLHLILDVYSRWFDLLSASIPSKVRKILEEKYSEDSELVINQIVKVLVKLSMWLNLIKEGKNEEGTQEQSEGEV